MQSILCIQSSLTCEERHKTAPCELKTKKAPIMATDDNMDMRLFLFSFVMRVRLIHEYTFLCCVYERQVCVHKTCVFVFLNAHIHSERILNNYGDTHTHTHIQNTHTLRNCSQCEQMRITHFAKNLMKIWWGWCANCHSYAWDEHQIRDTTVCV